MTVESRRTSFYGLTASTDGPSGDALVARIEIPLFQRDYAQGRDSDPVRRIRTDFLDALHAALAGPVPAPIGLDFVYGGLEDGTLRPLDGQQRLTTLFLLHWYIASRAGRLTPGDGWTRFSYATRQSARMFCESLVAHRLPDGSKPSEWIKDQSWYLFVWRHDPTVQSMLVMLDAIHSRFDAVDVETVWSRLTDGARPAVWFLLLPLSELGAGGQHMRPEELYIKMNSRGKPLTEFENFKAHFEKTIQWSSRAGEFALRVDTTWSDLLWTLRGDDDLIDDEFLRYMEYVTEVCEWRDGRSDGFGQRLASRTQTVFGAGRPQCGAHLDFLFDALDEWVERPIAETFASLFTNVDGDADSKVRLFFRTEGGPDNSVNLFEGCCRSYGDTRGRARVFSLGQTVVLYAVLLHLIEGTADFPRRVRVLRNLVEASVDELRPPQMPKILDDVQRLVRDGDVAGVTTLNQAQVADEVLKAAFLAGNPQLAPALFRLEDQELLRGSLSAFELDPSTFETRASAFHLVMSRPELWSDLLAALLATGEYQRQRPGSRPFLFGTDSKRHDGAWRDLLTGATRDTLRPTREVVARFLERVASSSKDLDDTLRDITREYLERCESEGVLDWRYYMVKYPAMRQHGSSTYVAEPTDDSEHVTMGYSLCMLQAGGRALNGYYRDPFLLAIAREVEDGLVEDKKFTGYETLPRRLPLVRSGAAIRCVPSGFELSPPPDGSLNNVFVAACSKLGADQEYRVAVPQVVVAGRSADTVDRIQLGADIVRQFAIAGL